MAVWINCRIDRRLLPKHSPISPYLSPYIGLFPWEQGRLHDQHGNQEKIDGPSVSYRFGDPGFGLRPWWGSAPLGGRPVDALNRQSSRQDSGHFQMEFFATFHMEISRALSRKKSSWPEMTTQVHDARYRIEARLTI